MNGRKAFNLTELMVASTLLVLLLVPVLNFNQRGVVEAGVTYEELMGRQLLMDLCERYKSAAPRELMALAADPSQIERDPFLATPPAGLSFERHLEFEASYQRQPGLHRATFVVSWASRHRGVMTVRLSRLVHYHDPTLE